MGEGGQTSSSPNSHENPLEELPGVHTESPKSLKLFGDIKNTKSKSFQKLPVQESPMLCPVGNGSCFSSPSSSPVIYRPMLPYSSSSSSMAEEYLDKLQDKSQYVHVPSPVANSGDSCSLVLPSFDMKSNMSESTSAIIPICRICHMPGDESEILINPCRCAGTLQFIHQNCLMVSVKNLLIFTPQPLRAVGVLFSPMVSGWAGGWESGRVAEKSLSGLYLGNRKV